MGTKARSEISETSEQIIAARGNFSITIRRRPLSYGWISLFEALKDGRERGKKRASEGRGGGHVNAGDTDA